ncbi:MAG: DUF488 family protein [Micropruina sp.]|uniref:DUF488 domain-containing protein n=1 Tax=Micropruina sp. TaxID=2737536 RepID=UPI0039E2EAEC
MATGSDPFRIKRVYEPAETSDGYRVLVDRLWPRGLSKDAAALDRWLPEAAPSTELRTWWHHDPELLDEFAARYRAELDANPAVDTLRAIGRTHPRVTLLYGARDSRLNQAAVLRDYLRDPVIDPTIAR